MRAHTETTPVAGARARGGPVGTHGQSGSRTVDSSGRAAPYARRTTVAGDARARLGCVRVVPGRAYAWAGMSSHAVKLLLIAAADMEMGCCGRRSVEAVPALVPDAVFSSSPPVDPLVTAVSPVKSVAELQRPALSLHHPYRPRGRSPPSLCHGRACGRAWPPGSPPSGAPHPASSLPHRPWQAQTCHGVGRGRGAATDAGRHIVGRVFRQFLDP
jgi:hypothetical protein